MAPDSSRKRLPFEPTGKGRGARKSSTLPTNQGNSKPNKEAQSKDKPKASMAIPEVVSQRMLRRMLIFSGTPTACGVIVFFVSYVLVVKAEIQLPPYAVLLTTLGCFGLGVLGLTYGVLSASWDEDRAGGWLGLNEFKVNFGRMTGAWASRSDR